MFGGFIFLNSTLGRYRLQADNETSSRIFKDAITGTFAEYTRFTGIQARPRIHVHVFYTRNRDQDASRTLRAINKHPPDEKHSWYDIVPVIVLFA